MKRLIILLSIVLTTLGVKAADVTLRNWDDKSGLSYYNDQRIQAQFAHFYPDKPCYIKNVKLYMVSENGGSADVVILGHQGGAPRPWTFISTNKVLGSAKITLPASDKIQTITVNIPQPIYTANDQFLIGMMNMQGCLLLMDTVKKDPYCNGNPDAGGVFGYQSLWLVVGNNAGWANDLGVSYAVDVIVEYPKVTSPMWLENQTTALGLNDQISNKSMATGDINKDGFMDLLVNGKLYLNTNGEEFKDATFMWNFNPGFNIAGNAFVDADNDGDLDILIFYDNGETHQKPTLYTYDGDKGLTPRETSIPGVKGLSSFNFGDLNNDGFLDMYVGQYRNPNSYGEPDLLPNYVLLHNGNISAPDWTHQPYICNTVPARRSRGSQMIDFDNDGDLDIYVANYNKEADELWENKGNMQFSDVRANKHLDENAYSGIIGHNNGTGVDWYDYDNDGDFDLLLSQFATSDSLVYDLRGTTIYNNMGGPAYDFTDTYDKEQRASKLGIEYEETHAGASFGDVDNDGLVDILTTTFYDCRYIDLFTQKPDHTFDNKTWEFGLDGIVTGEDAVWVDIDNDGKLDLAAGNNNQFRLFKNKKTNIGNFSEIDLAPTSGNKFGIGSKVALHSGTTIQTQMVGSGRGVRMQKPTRLHYGLGTEEFIKKIEVYWNGSLTPETFYNIEANKVVTLRQGEAKAPQKPAAPVLLSPANNAQKQPLDVTLTWQKVTNAMTYILEIAKDENFTNKVETKTLSPGTLTYKTKLDYDTQYWWRVMAKYYDATSDFNSFTFRTLQEISADEAPISGALEILGVAPSPASGLVSIKVFSPVAGAAQISIIDATGKTIGSAFGGVLSEGINTLNWNSSVLASGVYYLRLEQGGTIFVKQIVVGE